MGMVLRKTFPLNQAFFVRFQKTRGPFLAKNQFVGGIFKF